jgi:hypothetical protein
MDGWMDGWTDEWMVGWLQQNQHPGFNMKPACFFSSRLTLISPSRPLPNTVRCLLWAPPPFPELPLHHSPD